MTPIPARYAGTCSACGGRWQPGDLIRGQVDAPGQSGYWVHAACPDDPADTDLKPGETVCARCWLVHPAGECDRR